MRRTLTLFAACGVLMLADSRTDAVDKIFESFAKPDSPGCAAGVIQDGALIYKHGYGMADLEHGVPLSPSSAVYLASVSKQFTAAAVLKLVDQGKLKVADRVRQYVPELPSFTSSITIDHLLHHTSGLRDYFSILTLGPKSGDDYHISNQDFLAIMARQHSLNFQPGAQHLYSNSGYVLLSIIVERVSGKSLRKFAAEELFAPRGMRSTHFHDDHSEVLPNRAVGYSPRKGGGWSVDAATLDVVGDGGLFSTIEDLFRWDQDFPDGLLTKGKLNDGKELSYANGVVLENIRGLAAIAHGGGLNGYRTFYARFPSEKLSVAVLCNAATATPSRYAEQIADIYLPGKLAAGTPAAKPAPLASVTASLPPGAEGSYFSEETLGTIVIGIEDRKPFLRTANTPAFELNRREEGKWSAGPFELQFRDDELIVGESRAKGFVFRRVSTPAR